MSILIANTTGYRYVAAVYLYCVIVIAVIPDVVVLIKSPSIQISALV